jgi:hypothetical protein
MVRLPRSDLRAARPDVSQHPIDTAFVDDAQALRANPQLDPALLALHPETVGLEIRQKAPARFIVRMRHVISGYGPLSGDLANTGHVVEHLIFDSGAEV